MSDEQEYIDIPMGIENELCIVGITSEGKIKNNKWLGDSFVEWVTRMSLLPPEARSEFIRRLRLCTVRQKPEYPVNHVWSGATGLLLYCDQEKIEYGTPVCENIHDLVLADKGGELLIHFLTEEISQEGLWANEEHFTKVIITKNNTDAIHTVSPRDIHTWGSHVNIQVPETFVGRGNNTFHRQPFVKAFASLLAPLQLLGGAGGLMPIRRKWRYVPSPRGLFTAVYLDMNHGSHHSMYRPMFLYRGENDSLARHTRLQIVSTDSNMMPQVLFWKLGIIRAFVRMWWIHVVRGGFFPKLPLLSTPIQALQIFAQDASLQKKLSRTSTDVYKGLTMPTLLLAWLSILGEHQSRTQHGIPAEEREIIQRAYTLVKNAKGDPDAFSTTTDWGLKLSLLKNYCRKKRIGFSDVRARKFDALYADISPHGMYNRWQRKIKGEDPFAEDAIRRALWEHTAAPRSELAKKYFSAFADLGLGLPDQHAWAYFSFPTTPRTIFAVTDPMLKTRQALADKNRIESLIARLPSLEQNS